MSNDPYEKLREQLLLLDWPSVYLFKFIVPNESEKVAKVTALFESPADVNLQPSKTGKYISVGAKELMIDSESVINVYKKASKIEGIIPL